MKQVTEKKAWKVNGFGGLLIILGLIVSGTLMCLSAQFAIGVFGIALGLLLGPGLFTVQPNDSRVLTFFGSYAGSVCDDGFWFANPLALRRRVSMRVHNFNSDTAKVNDAKGNPIEIAAVVVWRVVDNSRALFDVENYDEFVSVQSETAIRSLASRFPYDRPDDEDGSSLRGSPNQVANVLREELQARLNVAGVEVIEARLSHLAYAPEIAQAMLRRQQAEAIIDARKQIVEGAVGMVEMALRKLSENQLVELDEEKKATMVNNLLVVLTSEQEIQPVINAGTLYG